MISLFIISCGYQDTKQKELNIKERELALKEKEFALKEKGTIASIDEIKEPSIKKDDNSSYNNLTTTSTSIININEFLGKWVRWCKENNCNDVIELKKSNNGLFLGDFYPECFEDAGFVQKGKLSGVKIIFPKDEGFQGCILTIENGKLIETNLNSKNKISYTKSK